LRNLISMFASVFDILFLYLSLLLRFNLMKFTFIFYNIHKLYILTKDKIVITQQEVHFSHFSSPKIYKHFETALDFSTVWLSSSYRIFIPIQKLGFANGIQSESLFTMVIESEPCMFALRVHERDTRLVVPSWAIP